MNKNNYIQKKKKEFYQLFYMDKSHISLWILEFASKIRSFNLFAPRSTSDTFENYEKKHLDKNFDQLWSWIEKTLKESINKQ